ncbi:16670_t:CDS:2 [Cetraspora pellucida]|uniref:16670_t:CDS:1 n=1 Tax=Cetraspora pellucida TaxID=1433469 RepID=A0ACA9K2L4_9GLOM|nr:16670_t:CDS:2 [Cetraspora pellucida]
MILPILLLSLILNSIYFREIVVFAADNCNSNTQNDPCVQTNALLKPCNATISKPPPTSSSIELQTSVASCACNQQFYNTLSSCAQCMSTNTLDVHVRDLSQYKDDCSSFGQQFLQNAPEPTPTGSGQNIVLIIVFVTIAVIAVGIVASLVICQLCRRRKRKNQKEAAAMSEALSLPESHFSGIQNRYAAPSPYSNTGYVAPSPTPPPQHPVYNTPYSNYPSYQ